VLDDLHWASRTTLMLLRHLARDPAPARLMIVLLYRDTEMPAPVRDLVADLSALAVHDSIRLQGLDPDAVHALAAPAAAGKAEAEALVRLLQDETGGNPLFIGELLRHLAAAGVLRDPAHFDESALAAVGLPAGVRGVIDRRVRRLSEPAQRALSVAAIAGSSFALGVLERVPDISEPAGVLDALDEAVGARLVAETAGRPGHYSFGHALIRQAILDRLTAARRCRVHHHIGDALEAISGAAGIVLPTTGTSLFGWEVGSFLDTHGADVRALAHHYLEAGEQATVSQAVRYATLAARQAVDGFAFQEALDLLHRGQAALEQGRPVDPVHTAELFLTLALLLELTGDTRGHADAALRAADEARAAHSAKHLAEAALAASDWFLYATPAELREMDELCEEALADLGEDSLALSARLLARLAEHRSLRGQPQLDLAREAVTVARQAGDDQALVVALISSSLATFGTPDARGRARLAQELLALADQTGITAARIGGLLLGEQARVELGDLSTIDESLAEVGYLALGLRSWEVQADMARAGACLALLRGRFQEAEQLATEQLQVSHHPAASSQYGSQLFFIRREQGRLAELKPIIESVADNAVTLDGLGDVDGEGIAVDTDAGPVVDAYGVAYRAGLALTYTDLDEPDQARSRFKHLADGRFCLVSTDLGLAPMTLCMLAEVCSQLGDADNAKLLHELLIPHAGLLIVVTNLFVCLGAADRYIGALAASQGHYEEAEERFVAALALEHRAGAPPFTARTRTWHARMLIARARRGDRARAADLLATAQATAEKLGMATLQDQAAALLRTL
jgi:hypothetical protein